MTHDFDEAMARARSRVAALDDAADRLERIRCRAQTPGGAVAAVVDGGGTLVELQLAGSVTGLPGERLAKLIVEAVQSAARDAAQRRRAVLDDLVADVGR